ncbi:SidA/IucD/PvdA family monooxygenase [Gordonia sp. ABSL1-1]|uniref:SidA/IucD/PvdA family monooxygenase n=1 Tax=Gordonia sp. ABSL1-1 TaxID=3053923 RepID=UPI002574858A|nr:SidA/IucD/PvdA family monooxygenase [Gordonia sp. ABSL1-1]MDL9937476.1 SidA/IucD/PvdA family monooxygenase [Gordonia sp. ABSL1-1]
MTGATTDRLIVVGAGPKAIAVAVKAFVLAGLGLRTPQVTVIEPNAVGGNWLESGGWTNGRHRLGTSPEKDAGFPYHSTAFGGRNAEINDRMRAFSWNAFLIDRGTYAEWIDRGRPSPQHHLWASYLGWIARKIDLDLVRGRVESVGVDDGRWAVRVIAADGRLADLAADRLMMTGPGSSERTLADHPRVLSVAEFWRLAARSELPSSSRAAVIGGGETAGSALDELLHHDVLTVSVISPNATIYTRGESYFENSLYSNPVKWRSLSLAERRDVVRRTDRGVFSVRVQETLLADERVAHLQGRVTRIVPEADGLALTLHNELRPDQTHAFDLVIDATGGDPLWFFEMFDQGATDLAELALGGPISQSRVESSIGYDLALENLEPPLYLPNLAGLAQGPGFPNLSSLGELSDRVLAPVSVGGVTQELRDPAHFPTTART